MSVLALLVVEKEHERRDGEEVEEMDTDRKSHKEGYEDDPSVRIRGVSLVVPLGHRPEYKGGEKGRHRVHLTLDS